MADLRGPLLYHFPYIFYHYVCCWCNDGCGIGLDWDTYALDGADRK